MGWIIRSIRASPSHLVKENIIIIIIKTHPLIHYSHVMEGMTRELLIESKEEVIVRLWKSCHYKIIERLRKFYKQSQTAVVKKGNL